MHAIVLHLCGYRIHSQSDAMLLFEKRLAGVLDAGLKGESTMS